MIRTWVEFLLSVKGNNLNLVLVDKYKKKMYYKECRKTLFYCFQKTFMKFAIAFAALPFMVAPALAGPYVESKSTTAFSDGTYKAAQTELRIGVEEKVAKNVAVFGEIGPGYEWNTGKTLNEYVTVGEVGVKAKVAKNVGVNAKVTGEYGGRSQVFDMGGELKVRYSF
jgi:hypothetical protein